MSIPCKLVKNIVLVVTLLLAIVLGQFSAVGQESAAYERYDTNQVIVEVLDEKGEVKRIVVPPEYQSAKSTFETVVKAVHNFRDTKNNSDLDSARNGMDLSKVNAVLQSDTGNKTALILAKVLEALDKTDPENIPSEPAGSPYSLYHTDLGEITIARQNDGHWRFTAETVATLPAIWDSLEQVNEVAAQSPSHVPNQSEILAKDLWLRRRMPVEMKVTILGLEFWQWILLLLNVFVAWLIFKIIRYVVYPIVKRAIDMLKVPIPTSIVLDAKRALSLILSSLFFWWGLAWIGIPEMLLVILVVLTKVLIWFSIVWLLFIATDLLAQYILSRQTSGSSKAQDVVIPLLRKITKVAVFLLAILFIADNLNIHLTGLLAGVGIGGIAFAFIAKDAAENFVAGLTVILDNSFHIGDWIKVGAVEGTVVDIGIRTTRVRTFYDSIVFIPNIVLVKEPVDNLGKRTYRRFVSHFWLHSNTNPQDIELLLAKTREIIATKTEIVKEQSHINLVETTELGYKIMLYLFFQTPDWDSELTSREATLLSINQLLKDMNIQYSHPELLKHQ